METVGDYISLIFLLVFGIWIGSIIHTYYMRQILAELKKMNQGTPIVDVIPPKKLINSVMYCSDCDTELKSDRTSCPNCGGSNRYLKNG
jgi:Zn finger protein HypA/HybF involved in hydrogenase expression